MIHFYNFIYTTVITYGTVLDPNWMSFLKKIWLPIIYETICTVYKKTWKGESIRVEHFFELKM